MDQLPSPSISNKHTGHTKMDVYCIKDKFGVMQQDVSNLLKDVEYGAKIASQKHIIQHVNTR